MTCRLSFCLLCLAIAGQAQAQPPVPPGVEPGESYHLIFVNSFDTGVTPSPTFPPFIPFFGGLAPADWLVTLAADRGDTGVVGFNRRWPLEHKQLW